MLLRARKIIAAFDIAAIDIASINPTWIEASNHIFCNATVTINVPDCRERTDYAVYNNL
jgi:hypothetical protein